jgi:mono/diheme cytochrome c family protein
VPLVGILAAAQLLFVWNMVQTVRGVPVRVARPKRRVGDQAAEGAFLLAALAFAALMFAVGLIVGRATKSGGGGGAAPVTSTTVPSTTAIAPTSSQGRQVFTQDCGSCHTLAAAGTSGTVGPNLDKAKPPFRLVVERVTKGRGAMPAFGGQLTDAQIRAVATYVSQSAGR